VKSTTPQKDERVTCRACDAGLPLVWSVQCKRTMHLAQGLSVTSCARIDDQERRRKLGS
jgi:hypothetical protein